MPRTPAAVGLPRVFGDQSPMLLLSLSLNLMLLAMFVVLNATANLDQKRVDVVLESVQRSFGDTPAPTLVPASSVRRDRGVQDALRSSLSEAFESVLQGDDLVIHGEADRLWVSTPGAALFEPSGALRAALPVFDRLVAVLNAPPADARYELLVVLPAPTAHAAADRAGILAEDLLRRGLRPDLLNIGAIDSGGDLVRFTFVVLTNNDPDGVEIGEAAP
jgi:hypothetical protein